MDGRLQGQRLTLAYEERTVAADLDVTIADGSFTVIVGPNACGKSTLLKALARVLRPVTGTVLLDGAGITTYHSKEVARRLGMLPQQPVVPNSIVVEDLVARGRYAHQRMLRQWSAADEEAVTEAMRLTEVSELADRFAEELSGGQRQRVWLAMVLAQQTGILLLDEPTTFLDLAHQFDVLDICADLHDQGRTIVAVLHDLNHACRYATDLIVMKAGAVVAQGPPGDVMTPALVEDVFGVPCRVIPDPETGTPMIVPGDRARRRGLSSPLSGSASA
ncbi:ABC transporter ATP-binding protein [Actinoplanes couchii]|uniref:ABC transporter n=1 Tax=Actinoplanes couchii TaxID=403638 RepID=A0ABQ3XL10_9ACTN|nr:ABC transporter ATP-binding protein [Actinoplanes couchii]MDR6319511.1 iron complex transport system ATP-binding protein [Actinoplanes couchii]GID59100.1 ABC transporter [Actinoplanes couchii]